MFYILYQVTNIVNGKIYVGVHKTKKLDDGYMGSGKVINAAIAKHGIENFTREILERFEDSTAMYAREKEIVTEEFLAREDTYNLRRGGFGGFDYINGSGITKFKGKKHKEESKCKMAHPGNTHFKGKTHSSQSKQSISKTLTGRKRSPESIAKQKEVWRLKKENAGIV